MGAAGQALASDNWSPDPESDEDGRCGQRRLGQQRAMAAVSGSWSWFVRNGLAASLAGVLPSAPGAWAPASALRLRWQGNRAAVRAAVAGVAAGGPP